MTGTPRILMVSRSLPFHGIGGMEAVAWDLARAFVVAGCSVTVLTTKCPALPGPMVRDGVDILPLDVPSGRYSAQWWQESRAVFTERLAGRTDIVLSVSAGAQAMALHRSGSMPAFVIQAHGTAWGEFVSKLRQKRLRAFASSVRNLVAMFHDRSYRRFDAMVAVGEAVAADLRRMPTRAIIGALSVHVIANGVDPEAFAFDPEARGRLRHGIGLDDGARLVLSASRLHAQKGVAEGMAGFIAAAQARPDLHMAIAGDGPELARLRDLAARSDMAGRIHFVGNVPRDRMRDWLSAADLFLFTTKRVEGLPLNILEARAAGLPVVASPHVLDPRFGGIAADPRDPQAIAAAIFVALPPESPNPDRPSRLAEEFTLAHVARQYIDLFQTLNGENPQCRKTQT